MYLLVCKWYVDTHKLYHDTGTDDNILAWYLLYTSDIGLHVIRNTYCICSMKYYWIV